MTTENFIFQKGSKILGKETGYLFKGEFLSRYKNEALKILRERLELAGSKTGDRSKTNFEKGMEICKDEYEVLDSEFKKISERIKKTEQIKKPYYDKIHQRVVIRKIETLKNRINDLKDRKSEFAKECDLRIEEINKEIVELTQ